MLLSMRRNAGSRAWSKPPRLRSMIRMVIIVEHAAELVCVARRGERTLRGSALRDVALIPDGAVVIEDETIAWVGPTAVLPPLPPDAARIDASGKTVLPGFVDSHTHLLFAGSREDEFEQRLQGLSYQEIAARGGGINATVRHVRRASKEELKALARRRLRHFLGHGVTTVEVKSG